MLRLWIWKLSQPFHRGCGTLKKRVLIIASINYRVTKQDHKFGIKIPKDIK